MKKQSIAAIFAFSILFSLLIQYSCKKEMPPKLSPTETTALLADHDFTDYLKNNYSYLTNVRDVKNTAKLMLIENPNNVEKASLASAAGFSDYNSYFQFFKMQAELKIKITNKFNFENLNEQSLNTIKEATISFYLSENSPSGSRLAATKKMSIAGASSMMIDCEKRYNSCLLGSISIYSLEQLGCGALAAGVAPATLGFGSVAVYILCSAAATGHYESMMSDCTSNYTDCLPPEN